MSERAITILNVDDSEANRYAVNVILQKAGYRVLESATGEEALEVAAREIPHVIILDIDLPGIDGFEVCRRVKADPRTASCSVIHLTAARMSSRDKIMGLDGGADAFLREPVGQAEIIATVESVLRVWRAERTARQATIVRDNLLAVVAHDLKSPLNAAGLSAQILLSRGPEGASGAPVRRHAELILRCTQQMNALVQDLLDLAKIRGNISLRLESVSAEAVVREHADAARTAAEAAKIHLRVQIPGGDAIVLADRSRLQQVFSRLIENALRFTPKDGTVTLAWRHFDQEVEFSVADSSPPIPPARIPFLFEQVGDHAELGIGLGFNIARTIVEQHGGRIWVESSDAGNTFRFTLSEREGR